MTGTVKAVRFPIVEIAKVLPGACLLCKNHNGPFVDTNIDKPMFGRVYICMDCVTEIAGQFGLTRTIEEPKPKGLTKEEFEGTVNELRDALLSDLSRLTSVLVSGRDAADDEENIEPLFDLAGDK